MWGEEGDGVGRCFIGFLCLISGFAIAAQVGVWLWELAMTMALALAGLQINKKGLLGGARGCRFCRRYGVGWKFADC